MTPEQRYRLDSQGFLILCNALAPRELAAVRTAADSYIAASDAAHRVAFFSQGRVVTCGRSRISRYLIPTYPPKYCLSTGVFEPFRAISEQFPAQGLPTYPHRSAARHYPTLEKIRNPEPVAQICR
jgi:hypothetical protein